MNPNQTDQKTETPPLVTPEVSLPPQENLNPRTSSKNKNVVLFLVLLILGLLVLLVYLFYKNTQLKQQVELNELDVNTIVSQESGQIYHSDGSSEFKKSQRALNEDFAYGQPFPNEISDLNEENLIGLKCTGLYTRHVDGNFYGYVDGSNSPTEMTEADLLQVVSTLNDEVLLRKLENEYETAQYEDPSGLTDIIAKFAEAVPIDEISKCDTDDGRTIIYYNSSSGGGGSESVSYYSYLENVDLERKVAIPTDGSPYFNCRELIALTKSDVLYVMCGGGDAGYGSSSVYAIDMLNNSYKLLVRCESRSNLDSTPPQISCIN